MKFPFLFGFCFLLFSQITFGQLSCDTLFLNTGEAILINSNYTKYHSTIKYDLCGDTIGRNKLRVFKKDVLRVGTNKLITSLKRKPTIDYNTALYLANGKKLRGRFLGANDASILFYERQGFLKEYEVKELSKIELGNNKRTQAFLWSGILLGGLIGVLVTEKADSDFYLGNLDDALINLATGAVAGGIMGGLIGSVKIKVNINQDQNQFDEELKKVKFY